MDYNIKQGDTLGGIAKKYGTTTQNLQTLNTSITDPNKIFAGSVLKVPTSSATTGVTNTSPIDASKLGTTTTPTIPPPITDTTASDTLATTVGTVTQGMASNQAQAQAEADRQAKTTPATPTNERQGIIDKITSILGIQGTQGQVSQDIYNQEGVFEKKKEVTRLENEALAKERAYQKRAEEIRANPQGKLESGIAIDLANLDRQKNQELADIAIQYKVAQGAYADANQIAEAKVKMQFEPLENQLKTLNNLYSLYQNDLSESEKMQAQAKIAEKEADLKFKRDKELLYVKADIDAAQKKAEAIADATASGVPSKIAKDIGESKIGQKVNATISFKKQLEDYGKLFKEYNDSGKLLSVEAQANLKTLRNNLDQVYSVANGQGAVQAGDRESYNKIIAGGLSFPQVTLKQIDTLSKNMDNTAKNDIQFLDQTYQGYATPFFKNQLESTNVTEVPKTDTSTNPFSKALGVEQTTFKFFDPNKGFIIPNQPTK